MQKRLLIFMMALFVCLSVLAQKDNTAWIKKNYSKSEHYITMRDGVELYTAVYSPKSKKGRPYPILMKRTCYSSRPYGADQFPSRLGPSDELMEDGYIFVYQDVRGRWMSDGTFDNMRPQVERKSDKDIDESTDTYDTIDWLINNIPNNNGKVGQWGVSYPGFYTIVGALSRHPALKASSPQAPIGDFYFDDFHHNGAYVLGYYPITTVFSWQKEGRTTESWYPYYQPGTQDGYQHFLEMGPLKNQTFYDENAFFFNQLVEHPDYDEFWQKRSVIPHLTGVDHAVMTVGGWFDAEDLYGPLNIYKTLEKYNPNAFNMIVMGPWSHGDWARRTGMQTIGHVAFGEGISEYYRSEVEYPFFSHFLKDRPMPELPEALMFDPGKKRWDRYMQWPPKEANDKKLYIHADGSLRFDEAPSANASFSEYVSDPAKPVPYMPYVKMGGTPRRYMADDQRFASQRPDVLVFQTEVLTEDTKLAGEIMARLKVATTGTDADFIVKLIDVYPGDHEQYDHNPNFIKMGGFQQMVRSEVIRGRYRNSFSEPEPFVPNAITDVDLRIQDVNHTFKKGHRIMVQIQSTWFPFIDRNPQTYVPNIFKAEEEDFVKATMRIYHDPAYPTHLEVQTLN
ncbi:MAG: CocE/NonD family hydrolase [Bacteroidota bacterium]